MLTTIDRVLFLMRAPATAEVTTEGLSRLAAAATEEEVARGDVLFKSGDEPKALFVVLDGAVKLDSDDDSRMIAAGDMLGALAVLSGTPHRATATAAVGTRLLRVDRGELQDLLDEDGELARTLMAGLLRIVGERVPQALAG